MQRLKAGMTTVREGVELTAVIVAVTDGEPRVLTLQGGSALPGGPFGSEHRSLQLGVRAWVEQQMHHSPGYIEQMYTFADRDRGHTAGDARTISISYLGLSRETARSDGPASNWSDWYTYSPWEDRRSEVAGTAREPMGRGLREWTSSGGHLFLQSLTALPVPTIRRRIVLMAGHEQQDPTRSGRRRRGNVSLGDGSDRQARARLS